MLHDEISAAAARERQKSWLAAAERSRQAQLARRAGPRRFSLRDGSEVLVRRVLGDDVPVLAEGFSRVSPRSRWLRFLMGEPRLAAEVRDLAEAGVDHHDHEALIAVDQATGRGVGVVRYIRDAEDREAAEVAVTVINDWQRLGLGSVLLAELAGRARAEGVRRLTALVATENEAGIRLLRRNGAEFVSREADTIQYELPVGPAGTRRWPRQLRPAAQYRF
jgi:ribosomal protein S18 acetylase RimI-like enzyme